MRHWAEETQHLLDSLLKNSSHIPMFEDLIHGRDYINTLHIISNHDTVLLLSIDGVQFYASKQSNCWIYIWIIMDLSPEL